MTLAVKQKVRGLAQRRLLPQWVQQKIWDREYRAGEWDSRHLNTAGDPIYPVLERHCAGKSVVDVGCGHGNTILEMKPVYRAYTGIDISAAAAVVAHERATAAEKTDFCFAQGFMHDYRPAEAPDVFLFRESIQYVARNRRNPEPELRALLARYASMLAPGGVIIVRICLSQPDEAEFGRRFETVARSMAEVIERQHTTTPAALILVLRPFAGTVD